MQNVEVLGRVMERHPELTRDDVLSAWENTVAVAYRIDGEAERQVGIGTDRNGRLLEMVAARTKEGGWIVYHAMTPPSRKTLAELRITRR